MISPGTLLQYDYNVNEIRLCLSENYYLWITYPKFHFIRIPFLIQQWKTIL